jgi:CHAD domain-containing protein
MEQIKTYVHTPQPKHTLLSNAKRPVKEVADEHIWKCYKRVLRQGGTIIDSSPADDLHTLRKSCKKLRYLIEFFASLYPPTKIKALVEALKKLQDMLGEYHDLHVHHEFFSELRVQIHNGNAVTSNTDHALEQVITALKLRQYESRAQFHNCFRDFTGDNNHKRFRRLFRP